MTSPLSDMDKIRKNPAQFYNTPHDVVHDNSLTSEKQNEVLKCWEDDIKALLRAEAENMLAADNRSKPAVLLSTISKLRAKLQKEMR